MVALLPFCSFVFLPNGRKKHIYVHIAYGFVLYTVNMFVRSNQTMVKLLLSIIWFQFHFQFFIHPYIQTFKIIYHQCHSITSIKWTIWSLNTRRAHCIFLISFFFFTGNLSRTISNKIYINSTELGWNHMCFSKLCWILYKKWTLHTYYIIWVF